MRTIRKVAPLVIMAVATVWFIGLLPPRELALPQLGVRVLQRSSQLVAAAAEVSRTFGEECAHEVRRNEQRQVGIPLRNRHAAPERRARL